MEALVSAVLGDLISRSISFAVDMCTHRRREATVEDNLQRLRRVLLRIRTTVEEAERRRVTNRAMLRQLQLMREGSYRGYYVLSAFNRRVLVGQAKAQDREVSVHDHCSSFALSQFSPAKRVRTSTTKTTAASVTGREAEAELQEVLAGLERMASDMKELVVFLSCYPPLGREPYSGHLWLENRMFCREAEQERIISFLLDPEPAEDLGVLPVIGRARVGKSTLVEHVCLDERVRKSFSSIVFLGEGDIKDGDNGIIKHQDLDSAGRSLVVLELDGGDVDESTLRRTLSTLRGERTAPLLSKVVVTSRSEKIAGFGTTQALELKPLPREAYWYFFKTIAFGSMDAEDQPELASICMEIAGHFKRSFISANLMGGLLRTNPCSRFWRKVLKGIKGYASMHLLHFGEHHSDLLAEGRPIYLWRLPKKTDVVLVAYHYYQLRQAQEHDLPKITLNELQIGSVRPRGKFEVLAWRSHIPPYYNYLMSCGVQTSPSLLHGRPPRNKQLQHRQPRPNLM